jgi:hypothetical protein
MFGSKVKLAGSSFLRAEGLVANTQDFEIWKHGEQYDNLIFQKAYWKEMMVLFKGCKILDLSDPDWIYGHINIVELGNLVDAITCSSEKLTTLVANYFPGKPVIHVPDRLNFNIFPEPHGKHIGKAQKVVWFGFINNANETLGQMIPAIRKHGLALKIVSNQPFENSEHTKGLDLEYVLYDQPTAYNEIKAADIVINPKSNRAFYKYKSNNKTVISWKLGLPVAENEEELERLLDPAERNKEVMEKQEIVEKEYNIMKSAEQYRDIFRKLGSGNK